MVICHPALTWVLRSRILTLTLVWQALYPPGCLPRPSLLYLILVSISKSSCNDLEAHWLRGEQRLWPPARGRFQTGLGCGSSPAPHEPAVGCISHHSGGRGKSIRSARQPQLHSSRLPGLFSRKQSNYRQKGSMIEELTEQFCAVSGGWEN